MHKAKFAKVRLTASVCFSALLGLSSSFAPTYNAQASCGTGEASSIGVDNFGPVHIGDTITVNIMEVANLTTSFKATNFNVFVVFPDNTSQQAMSVPLIPAGTSCDSLHGGFFDLRCPGGGANCIAFNNTYVVKFSDVGKNLSFSRTVGNFTAVCNAGGIPGFIQFEEAGAGAALSSANVPVGAASVCQILQIPVIFPCITISKACDNVCTPYGQPIFFHGTVSNTGDSALTSVTVTDTPPAGSTSSAITFDNVQPSNRVWNGTLAAGESAVYHGSYTPPNNGSTSLCGPFTDTISATAVDLSGLTISNTDACINPSTGVSTGTRPAVTATCHVQTTPAISLTKDCFKTGSPGVRTLDQGDTYVEVFVVKNTGDVGLTGVVINDDVQGTITIGTLDPGQSVTNTTAPITVTVSCTNITNHATATGTQICPADTVCPSPATVTSAQQQCTITVNCPGIPALQLIKTASPANAALGQPVTYYFAVTNTGSVTITNINIVDDNGTPNDPSDDFHVNSTPFSLAPGQGMVFAINHITEPLCMPNGGTNLFAGDLTLNVLANGDLAVFFMQSQSIVDNRYGTNATAATGWPRGHKFNDLLGSDAAEFQFTDGNGKVVLDFLADYISQATSAKFGDGVTISYPSGYGTLGDLGGDGKLITGSSSNVLSVHTTISDTLNQSPTFYGYTVNSPPETSPMSGISDPPGWDYVDGYYVLVSHNAFGTNGFGSLTIPYIHDSPSKFPFIKVLPTNVCECVVNTAGAIAFQGTNLIASSFDQAMVCFGPPTPCVVLGSCTPPYPFTSSNPLTSIPFNESGIMRTSIVVAATGTSSCVADHIALFYNDEHAMALGVRQVIVKTKSGSTVVSTTNNYPFSELLSDPESLTNPAVGSTILTGDQAGVDATNRPMFAALFITDLTSSANPYAGDWQFGGTPIPPTEVYGTWKGFVKTVDNTKATPTVTLTADADPAKNNWSLGPGSDPVPPGLANEGYGAEVRWDVSSLGLISGHTYRLYFMVHDGDQNKVGGDAGQACAIITAP